MKYRKFKIEQLGSCNILFKTNPRNKTVYCLERIHPIEGHMKKTFNGVTKEYDFFHYIAWAVNSLERHKIIEPGTIVYLPIAEGGEQ